MFTVKRPNMNRLVYVYDDLGASTNSTSLLFSSLQSALDPASHNIMRISAAEIKQGDWQKDCAALCLGGGYDQGFLRALGSDGAQKVRDFVLQGGAYLGFCAGAYFACDYIEFEKGTALEVCGHRPLRFYPGQCFGSVIPDFQYDSEQGAAAVGIRVLGASGLDFDDNPVFHAYVNGGGRFSLYPSYSQFPEVHKVEDLAVFNDLPGGPAAVVKTSVGGRGGLAILSSPHLEFSAFQLDPSDQHLVKLQRELRNSDRARDRFFKALLQQAGLRVRATVTASL